MSTEMKNLPSRKTCLESTRSSTGPLISNINVEFKIYIVFDIRVSKEVLGHYYANRRRIGRPIMKNSFNYSYLKNRERNLFHCK
jgi:hypothetical protein